MLLIIWIILFFFGLNFNYNKKQVGKKIVFLSIIFLVFVFSFYIIRRNNIIKFENQSIDLNSKFQNQIQDITSQLVFRYFTVINSDKSYDKLFKEMWVDGNILSSKINYDEYDDARGENNLLYNGNFNYGLLFWKRDANATKQEIIKTPYGNGVRVSRFNGDNENWSLFYTGRNIVFYSNHNFVLNFKFKVVSGKGIPFQIGFRTDDSFWGNRNGPSLQINTTDLENGWKQGTCSYTFQKSYSNIPFLMNSQKDSTIIEITDIKLMDSDTSKILPKYSDEISSDNQEINKYLIAYDSIVESEWDIQNKTKNLISNGDFRNGTQCWFPAADSTRHEIIETPFGKGIRVSRTNGDGGYWSLLYDGRPIIYYDGHTYRFGFNYKVEKGEALPFNIGWWVNEENQGFRAHLLPLTIRNINDGWKEATCSYKFKETHYNLPAFLNSLQDNSVVDISDVELIDLDRIDSIPIFVDQIKEVKQIPVAAITDTIDFRDFKNKLYSERTNRWHYSWVVFNDSLSISQKIFGGGFDYLEMFGKKFGIAKYDKPHNPFISTFLYSGILGGLAFIWFMIMVIVNYLLYLKRHLFFFISFVVTFFFVFFSDTSLFNTPLFTFLCLVPFFTKYFYLKGKYNDSQKISFKEYCSFLLLAQKYYPTEPVKKA
ncbi:MAG: carbohydrate binding domain-containing protein [Bacteroidales bacterium]|nr:carbohydrate binding domain-containing protein [Bacteroidales bacterium]